jgi:hypothetical protein
MPYRQSCSARCSRCSTTGSRSALVPVPDQRGLRAQTPGRRPGTPCG